MPTRRARRFGIVPSVLHSSTSERRTRPARVGLLALYKRREKQANRELIRAPIELVELGVPNGERELGRGGMERTTLQRSALLF
jgi:hypothetical protein